MAKGISSRMPRYAGSTNRSGAKKTTAAASRYGPKRSMTDKSRSTSKSTGRPKK